MSEVVKFCPADAYKNPDNVLEQAIGEYTEVLILGWNKDGQFEARASLGLGDPSATVFMAELFKHKLLSGDYGGFED